jgi:hypothetical protein
MELGSKWHQFHIDSRGYALSGDSRHTMISMVQRSEVYTWCEKNAVDATIRVLNFDGYDLWEVKDDQQRAWFALKWLQS